MKSENKTTKSNENKPVKSFRCGQVQGAIFAHKKEINKKNVTFYSTKIVKSYMDDKEEWKETTSYNREDLIKVLIVTQKCAEYIYLQESDDSE